MIVAVVPARVLQGGYLNHVSGAWAALADDVAHGVVYRPLVSSLGYGGTRYFPGYFLLHGLLVKLGLSLRAAGHLLSMASAAAIVVGGAQGLRWRGAPAALAWSVGVLTLMSRTAFMGIAGTRGDLLPVALGVWGLALTARGSARALGGAAFVLSVGMLTKPTLGWALLAAVVALWFRGQRLAALKLGAGTSALTATGMLAVSWASHGQWLPSFAACAAGGGIAVKNLVEALGYARQGELAWILGGFALSALRGRRALEDPMSTGVLACVPSTLFALSSKGTHVNLLVDASVTGALAVGAALAGELPERAWALLWLPLATCFGISELFLLHGMTLQRGELERAVAAVPRGEAPLLSEQPWIPLLAGERAYLLDAYALPQTRRASSAVDSDFLLAIDEQRFRAVILLGRVEATPFWYDRVQFGRGFAEHLLASYRFVGVAGGHAFYMPRGGKNVVSPELDAAGTETVLARMERPSAIQGLLALLHSSAK